MFFPVNNICPWAIMDDVMLMLLNSSSFFRIKEYLILQKTSKVDVDSSGKKCKEKMMSVLFETKVQAEHRRYDLVAFSWKTSFELIIIF